MSKEFPSDFENTILQTEPEQDATSAEPSYESVEQLTSPELEAVEKEIAEIIAISDVEGKEMSDEELEALMKEDLQGIKSVINNFPNLKNELLEFEEHSDGSQTVRTVDGTEIILPAPTDSIEETDKISESNPSANSVERIELYKGLAQEESEHLQGEIETEVSKLPEVKHPEARKMANRVVVAAALATTLVGGLAPKQAEAGSFLDSVVKVGLKRLDSRLEERSAIKQQELQARQTAENQARQAQKIYNQKIAKLHAQRAALDNPRLIELQQKQLDLKKQMQIEQAKKITDPARQTEKIHQIETASLSEAATAELKREIQRTNIDTKIAEADAEYDAKIEELKAKLSTEYERIEENAGIKREKKDSDSVNREIEKVFKDITRR